MPTSLPRIAVIGTGGTISSLGAGSLDVLDYPEFGQKLTSEALLDRFPETRQVAEPVPITFRQVGSTAIGPKDWLELRALIHRTAREVVKTSTYRVHTFRSFDFGALGHVDGDGPHFYRAPLRTHMPDTPFAGSELADLPRVDIIYSYAGVDGDLVRAAVAAGARGLVSAGFAPGGPSPDQPEAFIEAARSGTVVVQCTRAASGRVAPRRHLRESGLVAGEDFSPQKARILLMLMLTASSDI